MFHVGFFRHGTFHCRPAFKPRAAITEGYLPGGAFTKFLNINNGGSQKRVNPFSVFYTPSVKATVKRRH